MQCRRIIAFTILLCVIGFALGCHRRDFISREQIEEYPQYPIFMVITVEGDVYEFEPSAIFEEGMIKGTLQDGTYVEIAIARVKIAYAQRFDESRAGAFLCLGAGSTLVLAVVTAVGLGLLVLVVAAAAI